MNAAGAYSHDWSAHNEWHWALKPSQLPWLTPGLASLRIFDSIAAAAATDADLLIVGGRGHDGESVARAIHSGSARRSQAFVGLKCGALPQDLIDSELFGFECAAPDGSLIEHRGLLRETERGTLFLDEIMEMSGETQDVLLRFIRHRVVRPLGARRDHQVDVRIIAATCGPVQAIGENHLIKELHYILRPPPLVAS